MTDLVDQTFPPIHRKWTPEFTDFNYWKIPLQEYALPDLSPPSPTLSARSDTSNQSTLARLRNFSLGGNSARGGHINNGHSSNVETADHDASSHPYRNSHLRQMSSFEKLSSTLAFMTGINNGDGSRRSASPDLSSSYAGSDEEDGDEIELGVDGRPRTKRPRARSVTSMPGTLDQMHFDMNEEEEEYEDQEHIDDHYDEDEESYGYDGDANGGEEEEVEEEFDDDLLAAGAMRKVPFLYGS
jgi:phosphatidate phosphatase LPIN